MSWSTYQQPQISEAENRTANHASRNSMRPVSAGAGLRASEPATREPQHSIGNQSILRQLRRQTASAVSITGAPQSGQPVDAGITQQQPIQQQIQQQPTQQQPGQNPAPTTSQPMPYTAVFSIAQHGSRAKTGCGLPDTPNCVVSAANWRLIDKAGAPVAGTVTLSEQFTKESGPDDIFQKLNAQKNSAVTSQNGAFGDCYGLCVPDGTPSFSLQVLQNYLVNGQIAAKNHITYSPTGVMLRVCQREADGTFGDRCRRF